MSSLSSPRWVFTPAQPRLDVVQKLLALIECAGVIAATTLAALAVQPIISPGLGETLGLLDQSPPDYLASSLAMAKQFAAQYGAALALVAVLALARRRPAGRGHALSGTPFGAGKLLVLGIAAGLIASIPAQAIFLAKEIWPLGEDTVLWRVMESNPWDWTFWIFAATASFALVPLLEELMWRSYVLGRLTEAFRPGAALAVSTLVFAGLHVQYLASGDVLGYATMASVIFAAVIFSATTLTTGSIVPAIIAHAILNTPMNFEFGAARLALGVVVLMFCFRIFSRYLALIWSSLRSWDALIAILLIGALAGSVYAAMSAGVSAPVIAGVAVILTLLAAVFLKSAWRDDTDM